jgi:hypothetical protein
METLPRFGISRADMVKRVARFNELKGSDGGFPTVRRHNANARFTTSLAFNRRKTRAVR